MHGREAARKMVEPEAYPLVRIASEALGDEKGRHGYSYSGLCLTSLPHRKLAEDQAWERTVEPLTLIIEPGRIKNREGAVKIAGRALWGSCTAHSDLPTDESGSDAKPQNLTRPLNA